VADWVRFAAGSKALEHTLPQGSLVKQTLDNPIHIP